MNVFSALNGNGGGGRAENHFQWLCSVQKAERRTGRERNKVLITIHACFHWYQKSFISFALAKCIRRVSHYVIYCIFIASLVCITWEYSAELYFSLGRFSRFMILLFCFVDRLKYLICVFFFFNFILLCTARASKKAKPLQWLDVNSGSKKPLVEREIAISRNLKLVFLRSHV